MTTVELTAETFAAKIETGIVLVDFWAPWCGPCRAFAPIYEAASARHPDVLFAKVNTDVERALAGEFSIRAIPTLMAFRDGIPVFAQPGMLGAASLDDLLRQIRALDMNEIRREAAAQLATATATR